MARTKLKPCPFCGNKHPVVRKQQLFRNPETTEGKKEYIEAWLVACGQCSAFMINMCEMDISDKKEIERVMRWWNRRNNGTD